MTHDCDAKTIANPISGLHFEDPSLMTVMANVLTVILDRLHKKPRHDDRGTPASAAGGVYEHRIWRR
jgi:hypothetical protein